MPGNYTPVHLPNQDDGFDWALSEDGVGLVTSTLDGKPIRFQSEATARQEIRPQQMLDLLHRNLAAWEDEEESVQEEHEDLITELRQFLGRE